MQRLCSGIVLLRISSEVHFKANEKGKKTKTQQINQRGLHLMVSLVV